ncbi:hypothetical protein K1719_037664 [Acacia pycnantha]|nr:hypothetical protein K1719_037664 [Acacia pycnantha]
MAELCYERQTQLLFYVFKDECRGNSHDSVDCEGTRTLETISLKQFWASFDMWVDATSRLWLKFRGCRLYIYYYISKFMSETIKLVLPFLESDSCRLST